MLLIIRLSMQAKITGERQASLQNAEGSLPNFCWPPNCNRGGLLVRVGGSRLQAGRVGKIREMRTHASASHCGQSPTEEVGDNFGLKLLAVGIEVGL